MKRGGLQVEGKVQEGEEELQGSTTNGRKALDGWCDFCANFNFRLRKPNPAFFVWPFVGPNLMALTLCEPTYSRYISWIVW